MKNPSFVKIPDTVNTVGIKTAGKTIAMPGIWPLINEDNQFLDVIGVGNKNGLDDSISLALLIKYFPTAKLIFNCQSGPHLVNNYQKILRQFDGVMTLDFDSENPKSLFMNHSMMIRSLPFQGFFWKPEKSKKWDFNLLTTVGDKVAKRWDRALRIINHLCSQGLKGLVITQKGNFNRVLKSRLGLAKYLKKYAHNGCLSLFEFMDPLQFHQLQSQARIAIFPNQQDAFPKNIIENILTNKKVIISQDLLIGQSVISPEFGPCLDFDSETGLNQCLKIVQEEKGRKKPLKSRRKWLKRYGFLPLSRQWAKELDKKFGVKCRLAFFLNHVDRIKKAKICLDT